MSFSVVHTIATASPPDQDPDPTKPFREALRSVARRKIASRRLANSRGQNELTHAENYNPDEHYQSPHRRLGIFHTKLSENILKSYLKRYAPKKLLSFLHLCKSYKWLQNTTIDALTKHTGDLEYENGRRQTVESWNTGKQTARDKEVRRLFDVVKKQLLAKWLQIDRETGASSVRLLPKRYRGGWLCNRTANPDTVVWAYLVTRKDERQWIFYPEELQYMLEYYYTNGRNGQPFTIETNGKKQVCVMSLNDDGTKFGCVATQQADDQHSEMHRFMMKRCPGHCEQFKGTGAFLVPPPKFLKNNKNAWAECPTCPICEGAGQPSLTLDEQLLAVQTMHRGNETTKLYYKKGNERAKKYVYQWLEEQLVTQVPDLKKVPEGIKCSVCHVANFEETEMAYLPCGCLVCCVGRTDNDNKVVSEGDMTMYPPCMQSHVEKEINSGKNSVLCPGDCKVVLSNTQIIHFLPKQRGDPNEYPELNPAKAYKKHMEAMAKQNISKHNGVRCPACKTGMFSKTTVTKCAQEKCGIQFCTECKFEQNGTQTYANENVEIMIGMIKFTFAKDGKHNCAEFMELEKLRNSEEFQKAEDARSKLTDAEVEKLHMRECVNCKGDKNYRWWDKSHYAHKKCFVCSGTGKDRMCYVGCEEKGELYKQCKQFLFEEHLRFRGISEPEIQTRVDKKRKARKCPGCKRSICKDPDKPGCNHMQCKLDKTLHWCWQCGKGFRGVKQWHDFYDHYRGDKYIALLYKKGKHKGSSKRYTLKDGTPFPTCSRLPTGKCKVCNGVKGEKKCLSCHDTGEPDMTFVELQTYYTQEQIDDMGREEKLRKENELWALVPPDGIEWDDFEDG